ncbi:MAG: protein kinase [Candidatus Melainabacteria bacterium]|nr:protein kinase [Candidatus Melainabacteria bacterium]
MTSQDDLKPSEIETPPELTVSQTLSDALTQQIGSAPAQEHKLLSEGDLIAGKYKILGHLGTGGMSVVYKARDQVIGRDVALKMLSAARMADEKSIRRFQQEATAVGRLNHPNIVSVHDVGVTEGGEPFLIMDFAEGKTLADVVGFFGRCSPLRALRLIESVLDALMHAHEKGVVHRDLKPGNIIVSSPGGETERARVFDFGIAKLMPEAESSGQDLTQTGEVFGSPLYMSPEQCLGKPLDGRSDIYSVGCILYELICGQPPHRAETTVETIIKHLQDEVQPLKQICSGVDLPDGVDALVLKALAKSPDSRFQNVKEMRQAVSAVLENCQTPIGKDESKAKFYGIVDRDPASLILASSIAITFILLIGFLLWSIAGFSGDKKARPIRADYSSGTLRHMVDEAQIRTEAENGVLTKEIGGYVFPDGVGSFSYDTVDKTVVGRLTHTDNLQELVFTAATVNLPKVYLPYFSALKVEKMVLSEAKFDDNFLEAVSRIKTLRHLELDKVSLTEGKMEVLCQCAGLRDLSLVDSIHSDKALKPLYRLSELHRIDLSECDISDSAMDSVSQCKALNEIRLVNVPIGTKGLRQLASIGQLDRLNLSGSKVTDSDIEILAQIPRLTFLSLNGTNISNAALPKLERFTNLKNLELGGCLRLSAKAIAHLKAKLPSCAVKS